MLEQINSNDARLLPKKNEKSVMVRSTLPQSLATVKKALDRNPWVTTHMQTHRKGDVWDYDTHHQQYAQMLFFCPSVNRFH